MASIVPCRDSACSRVATSSSRATSLGPWRRHCRTCKSPGEPAVRQGWYSKIFSGGSVSEKTLTQPPVPQAPLSRPSSTRSSVSLTTGEASVGPLISSFCRGLDLGSFGNQVADALGNLCPLLHPMIDALTVDAQALVFAARYRVEEPQALDVSAVTPVAAVGHHNVIERLLLGATACQSDLDHLKLLTIDAEQNRQFRNMLTDEFYSQTRSLGSPGRQSGPGAGSSAGDHSADPSSEPSSGPSVGTVSVDSVASLARSSAASSASESPTTSVSSCRRARATRPVPAGIRRPTITFSLSPRRLSTVPRTAASVSTRVVSWKEAAEMNDSVASEALVMPSRTRWNTAGRSPSLSSFRFSSITCTASSCSPCRNLLSPESRISTLRSICRMMTSMCLSLIFTPWRRYTSWISWTR